MHCIDKGSVPLWILVHIKVSSKKKKFKIYFKTKTLWTVPLSLFLSLSWRLSVTKQSRWWLVLFEKAGREAGSAPSTTGNSETDGRQRSDCGAETIVGQSQLSENLFTSQESVGWIVRKQVERRRGEGRARVTLGNDWLSTVCYILNPTHPLNSMQYPGSFYYSSERVPLYPVLIFLWIWFLMFCKATSFLLLPPCVLPLNLFIPPRSRWQQRLSCK